MKLAKHVKWHTDKIKIRIEYDNQFYPSIISETFKLITTGQMNSAIKIKGNPNLPRNIEYQRSY